MNVLRSLRPLLLASLLLAALLQAQQKTATPEQTPPSTAPTLSVDARLVNLPVVVRAEKELLQDLTSSRPLLQAALKEIDTPSKGNSGSGSSDDDNNTSRRPRGG